MASSTKLKRLLENVDKADEYIVRQILKAAIIQSTLTAETTVLALANNALLSEPRQQDSVDKGVRSNSNTDQSPAISTEANDGEATSPPETNDCTDCGAKFNVGENNRGIKRCVMHPGRLRYVFDAINGTVVFHAVPSRLIPGPYDFRDFRKGVRKLRADKTLANYHWTCCGQHVFGMGCVQQIHKA